MSDLIKKLHLPAIIVSHPDLGMLNHTLLTIAALKQAGIPLAGVVVNKYQGRTRAEQSNPHVLRKILDRRILVVPNQPRFVSDFDALARHLIKQGLFNWPFLP
jgi:dethiobiotin synthetase